MSPPEPPPSKVEELYIDPPPLPPVAAPLPDTLAVSPLPPAPPEPQATKLQLEPFSLISHFVADVAPAP